MEKLLETLQEIETVLGTATEKVEEGVTHA
jgi:hypothetical protein